MCINPSTPALTASQTIPAYSMVVVTQGQNFKLKPSSAAPVNPSDQEMIVGVTDSQITNTNQPVTLQCGDVMRLTAANTIAAGNLVEPTTNGQALYSPPPYVNFYRYKYFQALESATAGQTFLAARITNSIRLENASP